VILGIETSCDDTCAAVVASDGTVRANVISSQGIHDLYGGVVPEVASRHHLELAPLVVADALARAEVGWDDVERVAVTQGPGLVGATQGPGLVGALLVGLSTAKALAAARELPFAAVDHLQGHVAANFLSGDGTGEDAAAFEPPFVCLIASGGHTLLALVEDRDGFEVLGRTLDDAAGEAFDKGARLLGLGYPGGAALERLAAGGDRDAFAFPGSALARARGGRGSAREDFARGLDFSFAGVKTALLYTARELSEGQLRERAADLAASYQAAIVDSLIMRAEQALEQTGIGRLAVGGGVAANGELRRRLQGLGVTVHVPPPSLCTDNAAMIASAARFSRRLRYPEYLGLDAYASGERPR